MEKKAFIAELIKGLPNEISINDVIKETEKFICPLTKENASLIERFIERDKKYGNKLAEEAKKNGISKIDRSTQDIADTPTRENLESFVRQVAIITSIRGATKSANKAIVDFIISKGKAFYDELEKGEQSLVQEMESYVYRNADRSRRECSWCSKVCKFLNEYLFECDGYYIYDSNVVNELNDYRKYYGLDATLEKDIDAKKERNWYVNLWNSLDEIRNKANEKEKALLKRSEIDHIIWGFKKYKVNIVKFK